jgi:DNA polymerase (family 10)
MHSHYSDGRHSLEEIAEHILKERGDSYFAITDHSKAVGVAGGMDDEGFLEQMKEVRSLKERYGEERIFQGAEVDILGNGELDLKDSTLAEMDWVVASIHSGMDSENTERLIKACEDPYVNAIGHPSGRLIGSRSAYELDFDRILEAAADTGTALEINAQPQRMDLDDERARKAKEKGIWLVIDTDMHRLRHLDHRPNGVAVARRAWCRKTDILNAQPAETVRKMVQQKRERLLSKA